MADLSSEILGVRLKNPLIAASGCFGFGLEYEDLLPPETFGGVSLKGTTLEKRLGNPPPRVAETPGGMLNSVGLQNPGVDAFVEEALPKLAGREVAVIANIAGATVEDYRRAVERLSDTAVSLIELNISCPNVREGGAAFGSTASGAAAVMREVRKAARQPVIVKLTPNVTDITEIARAVEAEGADGLTVANTLLGMRIDIESERPVLRNNFGGLSGPAVFPVALRLVWQVYRTVKIPVIGSGGIHSAQSVIEMMMAGAAAVEIGTAIFQDPLLPARILADLERWLDAHGIRQVTELTGSARGWQE